MAETLPIDSHKMKRARKWGLVLGLAAMAQACSPAAEEDIAKPIYSEPLAADDMMRVETLPADYPDHYLIVADWSNKFQVVDLTADAHPVMGQIGPGLTAVFSQSASGFLTASTHFSRTYYGVRTDVVTFIDPATLLPTGEIVLPRGKRALFVPVRGMTELIDDDRLLLVFNFTPASSVSVIDMESKAVVNEIPIPGCSLVYPLAGRSFATLCGNGTIASYTVSEDGSAASETIGEPFNDIDNDPIHEKYAGIGGIAYFPSFQGNMQPIDLTGDVAGPLEPWPMVSAREYEEGWRPSGWQLIAARDGRLYVLMLKDGSDGSHEHAGDEVWVFDAAAKARYGRFKLKTPGRHIAATAGDAALLAVANKDGDLDVYDLSGAHQRTLKTSGNPAINWLYTLR